MLFSQRKGLTPAQKLAQIDTIDDDLKNGLWSALQVSYWDHSDTTVLDEVKGSNLEELIVEIWHSFFKWAIDTIPEYFNQTVQVIRTFFFKCPWYRVYDFLEFMAANGPDDLNEDFKSFCDSVLERESSAYRFVSNQITEITSPKEIEAIEEAIEATEGISGIKAHLNAALEHLSDRKSPDYRNSIKESISAVEAVCQHITGDPNATLGKTLSVLEKKDALHSALKKSFSSLYGYTSDADGIRHAMLEESNISFIEAKYMLVVCTSFINYILGKASELRMKIEKVP